MNNKYIIGGALVSLILIFFMGKSFGKNQAPDPVSIDGRTGGDGYLTSTTSDSDIQMLTARMYSDLDGINWWFTTQHETELWNKAAALNDIDLTRIINYWNKMYYSKHKETLYEAINNDNWAFDLAAGAITILLRKIQRITHL